MSSIDMHHPEQGQRMKSSSSYPINADTWAIIMILVVLFMQNSLSADTSTAHLFIPRAFPWLQQSENLVWSLIKQVVFLPLVVFWFLGMTKYFSKLVVAMNGLLTLELFISTVLLTTNLGVENVSHLGQLVKDTILIMTINLLIFSMWNWIIDSPNLRRWTSRESETWDFLFPQRASTNPQFANWAPEYFDYLFLAFCTTFTFGPTDTLPLSQRAKLLMLLQVTISVINITVLAAFALSILSV
jgi:hypothetical protein